MKAAVGATMWLERIEVNGFGCLQQEVLPLEPGCAHVVVARNESGKSTLLAAIEVALYGWPSARTGEGQLMRQQFRPWAGGASRIVLELTAERRRYQIVQELLDAGGSRVEELTLWRDGQDVTDELRAEASSPGEWLLGLSREDFRRSVLVRQGELERVSEDAGRLVKHLEAVVTSSESGAASSDARRRLGAALDTYRERAGLDHWSESHLSKAIKWSRVAARLDEAIDAYEAELAELTRRRRELAAEIEQAEAANARLSQLRRVREALQRLQSATYVRDRRRQLEADDTRIRRIAELEAQMESHADVAAFPAERADEFVRLREREAQRRDQWSAAQSHRDTLDDEVQAARHRLDASADLQSLVSRVDGLQTQLTLYQQALRERQAAVDECDAIAEELERSELPLVELRGAHALYQQLTVDERQRIGRRDQRQLEYEQERGERQRRRQELASEADAIERRRGRRRRQGITIVVSGLVASGAVVALFTLWILLPAVAIVGGLLGGIVILYGAWRILSARQLEAYAWERIQHEGVQIAEADEEAEQNYRQGHEHLRGIAGRLGLTDDALLRQVRFYTEHRDQLDRYDRAEDRCSRLADAVTQHQQQWAAWLERVGETRRPDEVDVATARSLLDRVQQRVADHRSLEELNHKRRLADEEVTQRRRALRETQEAMAEILDSAGVAWTWPTDAGDEPTAAEEIVVAARAFEDKRQRHAQRAELAAQRARLHKERLDDDERAELITRIEHATPANGDTPSPADTLAWLIAPDRDAVCTPCQTWTLETLTAEEIAAVERRVDDRIEQAQGEDQRVWQNTRAFLRDYTQRRRAVTDELATLRAERERGQFFATAIEHATATLEQVESRSYAIWSQRLTEHLRPLLATLLPDYELDKIADDLAPLLVHRPTGQRLDLEAIRLHLSRGAKDRLFLALRLALAQVLGSEHGVRLPVLLDDPLANWDDASVASGLAAVAALSNDGHALVLFTCQRGRHESVVRSLQADGAKVVMHDFRGDSDAVVTPPTSSA